VYSALAAADQLEARGFSVGVVNARFVKPLDTETMSLVLQETGAILTLEEHAAKAGFGSSVAEWLAGQTPAISSIPVEIAGLPDEFIDHGPPGYYLDRFQLTPEGICARVEQFLSRLQGD
jgi:1-deoxy-D-xylulose-5-phosphate synthase